MILIADMGVSPVVLFIGALAITTWVLLMRSHRWFRRQPRNLPPVEAYGRQESAARMPPVALPAEAAKWEVQMHEIARELSARLDSKMGALEHLIHEADRAAARLDRAVAAAQRAGVVPAAAVKAPAAQPLAAMPNEPWSAPPASQADGLKTPRETAASSVASAAGPRNAAPRGPTPEQRYEEIYTLANYGHDAAEIAQRVGSPIGEVELILSLRRKR
jgi:hypothetical protein